MRLLSALILFTAILSATCLDICAYTRQDCIGRALCCFNIPMGECCIYSPGYGSSTKVQNLPPTQWFVSTYRDRCRTSNGGIGSVGGSSACLNAFPDRPYLNTRSAQWSNEQLTRRHQNRDMSSPNVDQFDDLNRPKHASKLKDKDMKCVEPNGMLLEDGRRVDIPAGQREQYIALLEKDGHSAVGV